jgi:hypothetical protein
MWSKTHEEVANVPIHIFVFHSGDKVQLMDWYSYHSRIVGWKRLHGIAHNYNDPETIAFLRNLGADIITFNGAFAEKGKTLTKRMLQYTSRFAYLLPLDLDEYLVAESVGKGGKTFSADVDLILAAFNALPADTGFKYKMYPYMAFYCNNDTNTATNPSIVRRVEHFFRVRKTVCGSKSFFYGPDFIQIDQGSHFGVSKGDNSCTATHELYREDCDKCFHNVTGLGLLHYGVSSSLDYDEFVAKAIKGAAAYNQSAGEDCSKGGGQHYCKFLEDRRVYGDDAARRSYDAQKSCEGKQHNTEVKDELEAMYRQRKFQNFMKNITSLKIT